MLFRASITQTLARFTYRQIYRWHKFSEAHCYGISPVTALHHEIILCYGYSIGQETGLHLMTIGLKTSIRTDWFDEICETLNALMVEAYEFADDDDCLPKPELFAYVKQKMDDLRRLADYPNLSTPDVWLGQDAQIGLTWKTKDRQLDLIFSQTKLIAKLRVQTVKSIIEPNFLPVELKKFAA